MPKEDYKPGEELERLAQLYAKYGYSEQAGEIRARLRGLKQRYDGLAHSIHLSDRRESDSRQSSN